MKAFFISPFGNKEKEDRKGRSDFILNKILIPAFSSIEIEVIRGDIVSNNLSDIDDKIVKEIVESLFVIVDDEYKNPNVFFEAGIAWAINKPSIYLTKYKDFRKNENKNNAELIPFNFFHKEHIYIPTNWELYKYNFEKFEEDKKQAISTLRRIGKSIKEKKFINEKRSSYKIIEEINYLPLKNKDTEISRLKNKLEELEIKIKNIKAKQVSELELDELLTKLKKSNSKEENNNLISAILEKIEDLHEDQIKKIEICKNVLEIENNNVAFLLEGFISYYQLHKKENLTEIQFKEAKNIYEMYKEITGDNNYDFYFNEMKK